MAKVGADNNCTVGDIVRFSREGAKVMIMETERRREESRTAEAKSAT